MTPISKSILAGLSSAEWKARSEATRNLKNDLDLQSWIFILTNCDDLLTSAKSQIIQAILPVLLKSSQAFSSFCYFHILTRILPVLRDGELELDILNSLFTNKRIAVGLRAKILTEALKVNFVPNQRQRRLTDRLIAAMGTCPTHEGRYLIREIIQNADNEFVQKCVIYLCLFKEELTSLLRLEHVLKYNESTRSRVYTCLFGTDPKFGLWKRRSLNKIYGSSTDKEILVRQILASPKQDSSLLAFELFQIERDANIRVLLSIAIGLESTVSGLSNWWNAAIKEPSLRTKLSIRSRVIQRLTWMTSENSKINLWRNPGLKLILMHIEGSRTSVANSNIYTEEQNRGVRNLYELNSNIQNVSLSSLHSILTTGRKNCSSLLIPTYDYIIFRALKGHAQKVEGFISIVVHLQLTDELSSLSIKLLLSLNLQIFKSNWRNWINVLIPLLALGANKSLERQIIKILSACLVEAISQYRLGDNFVFEVDLMSQFLQCSKYTGIELPAGFIADYLNRGGSLALACAALAKSRDEILSIEMNEIESGKFRNVGKLYQELFKIV
jgi:hypothetical protein